MRLEQRPLRCSRLGRIDPHFHGTRRRPGEAGGEAFRVRAIRRGKHSGPRHDTLRGQTMVHVVGRQQAEAAVVVLDRKSVV